MKGGREGLGGGSAPADGPAAGSARQTDSPLHQGQVGHGGRQVQLELRPGSPEIAGPADARLDQSGKSVFHHHSARSMFVVPGALSQGPILYTYRTGRILIAVATSSSLGRAWTGCWPSHYPRLPPLLCLPKAKINLEQPSISMSLAGNAHEHSNRVHCGSREGPPR